MEKTKCRYVPYRRQRYGTDSVEQTQITNRMCEESVEQTEITNSVCEESMAVQNENQDYDLNEVYFYEGMVIDGGTGGMEPNFINPDIEEETNVSTFAQSAVYRNNEEETVRQQQSEAETQQGNNCNEQCRTFVGHFIMLYRATKFRWRGR